MLSFVKHPHFLPTMLCFIYAGTAIRYAVARDWGRVGYWLCAAGINVCATWGIGK